MPSKTIYFPCYSRKHMAEFKANLQTRPECNPLYNLYVGLRKTFMRKSKLTRIEFEHWFSLYESASECGKREYMFHANLAIAKSYVNILNKFATKYVAGNQVAYFIGSSLEKVKQSLELVIPAPDIPIFPFSSNGVGLDLAIASNYYTNNKKLFDKLVADINNPEIRNINMCDYVITGDGIVKCITLIDEILRIKYGADMVKKWQAKLHLVFVHFGRQIPQIKKVLIKHAKPYSYTSITDDIGYNAHFAHAEYMEMCSRCTPKYYCDEVLQSVPAIFLNNKSGRPNKYGCLIGRVITHFWLIILFKLLMVEYKIGIPGDIHEIVTPATFKKITAAMKI
jgi:hypothetical protein